MPASNAPRRRNRRTRSKSPHKKSGLSLVVLDNPDDGELFESGDASDMGLEHLEPSARDGEDDKETSDDENR